jgi:type I restriction enzyme, R subunit
MVLLARWLLEQKSEARVLVVTDRDELDKQIEGVMKNAGVIGEGSPSPRITSRAEFVAKLGDVSPRLLCALIHSSIRLIRRRCAGDFTYSWMNAIERRAAP